MPLRKVTCEKEHERQGRRKEEKEGGRRSGMRKSVRLASNYLINMNLTHPLTLSRTCKALAVIEVHTLHALGKHDLVDST
jgi:hypothetical protein